MIVELRRHTQRRCWSIRKRSRVTAASVVWFEPNDSAWTLAPLLPPDIYQ